MYCVKTLFQTSYNYLSGKLNRATAILDKIRNILPLKWSMQLYNSFLKSFLQHGNDRWPMACKAELRLHQFMVKPYIV